MDSEQVHPYANKLLLPCEEKCKIVVLCMIDLLPVRQGFYNSCTTLVHCCTITFEVEGTQGPAGCLYQRCDSNNIDIHMNPNKNKKIPAIIKAVVKACIHDIDSRICAL